MRNRKGITMLYEKNITPKGKVSYKEWNPEALPDVQIDTAQLVAIFSAMSISMLVSLGEQLPKHARIARECEILSQAIGRWGNATGEPLNGDLLEIGVQAWKSAILAVQVGLLDKSA